MRTTQDALNSAFAKWSARKFYKVPARHTGMTPLDVEPETNRSPEERAADHAEDWKDEEHLDRHRSGK